MILELETSLGLPRGAWELRKHKNNSLLLSVRKYSYSIATIYPPTVSGHFANIGCTPNRPQESVRQVGVLFASSLEMLGALMKAKEALLQAEEFGITSHTRELRLSALGAVCHSIEKATRAISDEEIK